MSNDLIPFGFDLIDRLFHRDNWLDDWGNFINEISTVSTSVPTNMKIKEDRDIEITMAVAGYPKENIDLDFDGDYLTITLRKVEKNESEKEKYVCKSIKNSFAKQRFAIPASRYSQEETKADLKDGLLIISIPAKEEAKPKKININLR